MLKKGNFGADLGTFQQAHVAKTIVFIMFLLILEVLLLHQKDGQNGPENESRWLQVVPRWAGAGRTPPPPFRHVFGGGSGVWGNLGLHGDIAWQSDIA